MVEDCREDPVAIGDLLPEHAAAGSGAAVPAALAVTALLDCGRIRHDEVFEQVVEYFVAHAGERVAGWCRHGGVD